MSEVLLETRNLSFTYPGEDEKSPPALEGIDLQIADGEYVALIGPNGSGKTTLLKQFNALLRPTSGELYFDGRSTADENNIAFIRAHCGMIFQNPDNQIVGATVEEDVAFALENLAVPPPEIRRRVAEALELLGISQLAATPPYLLSGGEKQKVAMAGILAAAPRCLLLDEPTAMLDPAGQAAVIDTLQMLNRERGITVVHVTHFPEEAALARRVIVLDRGRLVQDGPPAEILTDLGPLRALGLRTTAAGELAGLLREDGFPLCRGILHNRELVEQLCLFAQKI
ncbi:MAG TPA: energy-coupling factor transporter ATPase [Bacillota bacterium]|nr:energy-coupling factor transporter ATPase [Bacillota bacterium]HOL17459.1 energy-coupling factor transporter ATPase [Bacillota bacterium]